MPTLLYGQYLKWWLTVISDNHHLYYVDLSIFNNSLGVTIGVSRSTIKRYLKQLVDNGSISRECSDKTGSWGINIK